LKRKRKIATELQLGIFIWAVEGDQRGALRWAAVIATWRGSCQTN
jgi:hypothetical protein